VTNRTRAAAAVLLISVSFLVSCGGDGGPMHATLTDDGCTFEGDTTADAGRFAIEVENRTRRFASFGVIALLGDQALDESALARERVTSRLLLRSRARSDSPPPYGRWIGGADVEPSATTSLPVDTAAGRYAVACFVHSNSEERLRASEIPPPERSYVAAQFEVTGLPTYP
jgi:hypothetical protein